MKETILLAPGVNGTELLRTLAKNGKNTLGMRVLNGVQLAQEGLIRAGIPVTEEFLTRREETSLYDSFFREIPYFASASFADAQQLAGAIYRVRSLSLEEEAAFERLVSEGEFREKNEALRKAYPEIARGEYTALNFKNTKLGGFLCTLDGSTAGVFHNTTEKTLKVDLAEATDYSFTEVAESLSVDPFEGFAELDGTVLTLGGQTSAILR